MPAMRTCCSERVQPWRYQDLNEGPPAGCSSSNGKHGWRMRRRGEIRADAGERLWRKDWEPRSEAQACFFSSFQHDSLVRDRSWHNETDSERGYEHIGPAALHPDSEIADSSATGELRCESLPE